MTGLDLVVVLFLAVLVSSVFTALVMRARANVGERRWHAHMEARRIVVRSYTETFYNGSRRYDEAWSKAFDPADVDSRSAALAEAEDVMAGMRDLDRRLHELRASP